MRCKSCGTDLTGDLKFCPHCGEKLASVKEFRCTKCADVLEYHWKYCPICGTPAQNDKKTTKNKASLKKIVASPKKDAVKKATSFNERRAVIYAMTPQNNCGECGCVNCMQFAMKAASSNNLTKTSDCPYI